MLSKPSSQAYASWDGSDTSLLLVYLVEYTVKYNSQDPLPTPKVPLAWFQLCDICYSVNYCTEVEAQI